MLTAPALLVSALVVLLTLTASPSYCQTLRLDLFNDSSCTVPSTVAGIGQPVPTADISTCMTAPASLSAVGYSSYQASCGVFAGNNQTFALVHLWSNTSTNAATCPTTASYATFITVADSTLTHTSSSCIGPFTANNIVNQTASLSSQTVYAQFDCQSESNTAGHTHLFTTSSTVCVLLLLLLCGALDWMV